MASQPEPMDMSVYDDEGADQAPNGERRLHIQAYDYWETLLHGRAMPAFSDLSRDGLAPFLAKSFLIDFENGYMAPVLRHVGDAIESQSEGLGLAGSALIDVPRKTLLGRLADHYMEVLANRAPIGFEAEFLASETQEVLYRGILLPLSDDDEHIHMILGVINWKVRRPELALAAEPTQDRLSRANEGPEPEGSQANHDQSDSDKADGLSDEDVAGAVAKLQESLKNNSFDTHNHDGAMKSPFDAGTFDGRSEEKDMPGVGDIEPDAISDHVAGLETKLRNAQIVAAAVLHADSRGRDALYKALASSMAFYEAAQSDRDGYHQLLSRNSIKEQARAPFTPVVKLVFGKHYEKSRLNEYSLALAHAQRDGVGADQVTDYLRLYDGGIKGCVKAERSARREESASSLQEAFEAKRQKLREAPPIGGSADAIYAPGKEEFVLIMARRVDSHSVAAVKVLDESPQSMNATIKRMREDEA